MMYGIDFDDIDYSNPTVISFRGNEMIIEDIVADDYERMGCLFIEILV